MIAGGVEKLGRWHRHRRRGLIGGGAAQKCADEPLGVGGENEDRGMPFNG